MTAAILKWSTALVFTESARNIGEITETHLVCKVHIRTICRCYQISEMLHSDIQKILIYGISCGLFEAHFYATSRERH